MDGVWLARCPRLPRRSFSTDVPDNVPESHTAVRPFPGPRQASQSDVPDNRPLSRPGPSSSEPLSQRGQVRSRRVSRSMWTPATELMQDAYAAWAGPMMSCRGNLVLLGQSTTNGPGRVLGQAAEISRLHPHFNWNHDMGTESLRRSYPPSRRTLDVDFSLRHHSTGAATRSRFPASDPLEHEPRGPPPGQKTTCARRITPAGRG